MGPIRKFLIQDVIGKGPVALAHLNFFIALSGALVTTIWALYINSFVNSASMTGLISGFLSIIAIISYFAFIPLFNRDDKRELFAASLAIFAIFYTTLYFLRDIYTVIFISILITVLHTIRITSFGVILKSNASDEEITEKEGLNWTFVNLGWVIGPVLAGYLANRLGIRPIFLAAAFLSLIALFIFYFTRFEKEEYSTRKISTLSNFKEFFMNKKRFLAYVLTGGSSMWWAIVYIYMPLYMSSLGFGAKEIGYLMLGAAFPLILFEHGFSKISKKTGFRKMFFIGFAIPAIFAALAFFINIFYLQVTFIVLASIGLAMLEPTTEAYFLKVLTKEETARFFGPYSTSRDISQLIAKVIPALVLIILPFRFVFLSFFIFMALMAWISLAVKD